KEEWQNCLAPCAVEALHIADATTDDDDIRIEDIDHVGQRLTEQQVQAIDSEFGHMIISRRRCNLGQRQMTLGLGLIPGLQRGAADEGLDTATLATVALGTIGGEHIVAPLTGDAVMAIQDTAIDDDAGAHAGAHYYAEHHLRIGMVLPHRTDMGLRYGV